MKKIFILVTLLLINHSFANDPLFFKQWGLENTGQSTFLTDGQFSRKEIIGEKGVDINLYRLNKKPKKNEVVVAVLDTGFDINHSEFKGRLWENPACAGKSDEERKKLPCNGWNFLDENSNLLDEVGHGTHVAGIIASNKDGKGIEGVTSKQVKIMPLKILSPAVNGFVYKRRLLTDMAAKAIKFAIANKVDVINLSLGWPSVIHTKTIRDALDQAIRKNIAIVAASGNNHKTLPIFPCSHKGVICVGAINNQGKLAGFSNYGGKVDILAPGQSIIGPYPLGKESRVLRIKGYEQKNGSSQAAPFVSAILAEMKLFHGDISLNEMKSRIYNTARKSNPSIEGQSKYGLIDMKESILTNRLDNISVDFKSLKVIPTIKGKFELILPLINLRNIEQEITYRVVLKDKNRIIFSTENEKILVSKNNRTQIIINSILADNHESDLELIVELNYKDKTKKLTTQVAFARNLNAENILEDGTSILNKKNELAVFKGSRKYHRLKVVGGLEKDRNQNLYYNFKDKKLRIIDGKSDFDKILPLKPLDKVLAVFQIDANLDGNLDFFVYGISMEKNELYLDYFDKNGNPLYEENSRFILPISTFEGLPVTKGEEDFQYITIKHDLLGKIKMPALKRSWSLPEEDNNEDLLDRLPNSNKERIYFLNPTNIQNNDFNLEVRTIESYSFMEDIRKKLSLDYLTPITLGQLIPQTALELENGTIRIVLGTGEEFDQQFYEVNFSTVNDYSISLLGIDKSFIENNKAILLKGSGSKTDKTIFTTLLMKNSVRFSINNNSVNWSTGDWKDPVFDILGGFVNDNVYELFVESRYYIHYLNIVDGVVMNSSKLPINRDSSFPGVAFSESMSIVSPDGRPGLNIDSTLLYGERLYTMIASQNGLKRPLKYSFLTPKNCVQLGVRKSFEHDEQVFLCDENDKVRFKYLKLGN